MGKKQGFALLDPERHREIASLGGKAVHAKGTGHEWTTEEARKYGSLGGKKSGGHNRKVITPVPPPAPIAEAGVRPQGDTRHTPDEAA